MTPRPATDFAPASATGRHRISERRDHIQSITITVLAGLLVLYAILFGLLAKGDEPGVTLLSLVSAGFAVLVIAARASSMWGAVWGGLCCFSLALWTRQSPSPLWHSLLPPLILLVLLTVASTRLGRARKAARGLAERTGGRAASQVLANLAAAAILVSPLGAYAAMATGSAAPVSTALLAAAGLAALAEAGADTVSSEIGQAMAASSRTILITTLRRVPRGTDGGVSLIGSLSGLAAAFAVVGCGVVTLHLPLSVGGTTLAASLLGFLGDSILGATVERRGWIGNDAVNFLSTLIAGLLALLFARGLVNS